MEGFDDPGVFFSDNFGVDDNQDELQINRQQIKNRLREFIRQFHEGNFTYTYRLVTWCCCARFQDLGRSRDGPWAFSGS